MEYGLAHMNWYREDSNPRLRDEHTQKFETYTRRSLINIDD